MTLWLRGGNLFLPDGDFERGDILIDDGVLAAVRGAPGNTDAKTIDLEGRWVLPGFIDLHVHLCYVTINQESEANAALQSTHHAWLTLISGVTTVRDVGGYRGINISLKRAIDRGWVPGPRVLASGQFIAMTGGHEHHQALVADGPEELRKAVRSQIKAGASWIKLMVSEGGGRYPNQPEFTLEEIRAGVVEAARHKIPVAAHAHPADAIKDALRAGVASIEHGTYLDDEATELLRRTGAFLVPTMAAYESIAESQSWPEPFLTASPSWLTPSVIVGSRRVLEHKLTTFKEVVRRGVRWGVGTDATGAHLPHGRFSSEMRLLHRAGLGTREILLQATKGNAQLLGMDDKIGAIEVGKLADLVVLEDNPLQNLSAAESVYLTIKGGMLYWPHLSESDGDAKYQQQIEATHSRMGSREFP